MKEIKIENLRFINQETIVEIIPNCYIFFKTKENNNKVGIYTNELATCSTIIISFNNDEYLFFSHIDESSDIITVIKEDLLKKLGNNITKIDINYSKGSLSLKNDKIDYDSLINNLTDLFKEAFNNNANLTINKLVKEHDSIFACLKLLKTSVLEKIKNKEIQIIQNYINKKSKLDLISSYEKSIDFYIKNIDFNNNIIYHFSRERLLKVLKIINISII